VPNNTPAVAPCTLSFSFYLLASRKKRGARPGPPVARAAVTLATAAGTGPGGPAQLLSGAHQRSLVTGAGTGTTFT